MSPSVDDSRPPFRQIADSLRARIRAGEFPVGGKLPTGRKLAEQYNVAQQTASNAVQLLREEGIISSQQGKGHFVRQLPREDSHSSDFAQVMKRLDALQESLQEVFQRLEELESQSRSPQRER